VQSWLQIHPSWVSFWLEGIDPPRRVSTSTNVSILMVASSFSKKNFDQDFGFICSVSRAGNKKKEREKECQRELANTLDLLQMEDKKSWCQMPPAKDAKREVEPGDLERLTKIVKGRVAKATVEISEPSTVVLVASMPFGPHERSNAKDPDIAILERLDPGYGELFREARRVSGLVRKQWYLSVVWAKTEAPSELRPFPLGVGFATDRNLSKARAVYSAEVRAQVFKESMLTKMPGGTKSGTLPLPLGIVPAPTEQAAMQAAAAKKAAIAAAAAKTEANAAGAASTAAAAAAAPAEEAPEAAAPAVAAEAAPPAETSS